MNGAGELDPPAGNGRAVTSAYPGVREDNTTDQYLANLDVSGYNYGWSHYVPAHKRVPSRVIAGTESFPLQSYQTWEAVVDNSWVYAAHTCVVGLSFIIIILLYLFYCILFIIIILLLLIRTATAVASADTILSIYGLLCRTATQSSTYIELVV